MTKEIENTEKIMLDFTKLKKIAEIEEDVLPVIVQDADSKDVLILAYANQEALNKTLQTKKATFWSTSRNELWVKGQTSDDYLEIIEVRVNCEQNSLLYLVKCKGEGVCHVNDEKGSARKSCYYRRITLLFNKGFIEEQKCSFVNVLF